MCNINGIWLFNLLVAFVLILQQQQHAVVAGSQSRNLHDASSFQGTPSSASSHPGSYDAITSYASALASQHLHRLAWPKLKVAKREIRNDKNKDFISYMNDFSMQDEASIPEDLFDQRHLQEIEEREQRQQKTAQKPAMTTDVAINVAGTTAAGTGTASADAAAKNVDADDDVIDVNLPYDDSDVDAAEADADIILESQRSIERNFSADDNDKGKSPKNNKIKDFTSSNNNNNDKNDNNNSKGVVDRDGVGSDGIGDMAKVRPTKDSSDGLEKLRKLYGSKKITLLGERKTMVSPNDKDSPTERPLSKYDDAESKEDADNEYGASGVKSTRVPPYTYGQQQHQDINVNWVDNYYDGLIDDEEDDDDGSAEYERFKLMREQRLREQEQREVQRQREEFNKQQQERELQRQREESERRQKQKELQRQRERSDRQQHVQWQPEPMNHMSPGKKLNERKFNKPSMMDKASHIEDLYHDSAGQETNNADNKKNNEANNDNGHQENGDGFEKSLPSPNGTQAQSYQDAIGDIDDDDDAEDDEDEAAAKPTATEQHHHHQQQQRPVVNGRHFTNMFIPRKLKRHNGAARLDDATNRYARLKKLQPLRPQSITQMSNENESNGSPDAEADGDSQEEYMPHFGPPPGDNFEKSYYGIVVTVSNTTEMNDKGRGHQADNGLGKKDNSQREESNEDDDKAIDLALSTAATATTRTPTTLLTTTTPAVPTVDNGAQQQQRQSLFEIEKSLRRNNKRYGHKTHKKKYKDYQRYSSLMKLRTPTTAGPAVTLVPPTRIAHNQQQQQNAASTTTTRAPATVIKSDSTNGKNIAPHHMTKYEKKLKMDKHKGIGLPSSPIFALKPNTNAYGEYEKRPFYEGHINYFLETDDDDADDEGNHDSAKRSSVEAKVVIDGDRRDSNDWYRKLSPILRNGVKSSASDKEDRASTAAGVITGASSSSSAMAVGGYKPYQHYRSHHQRQHQHGSHHHQRHHSAHHHHSRNHAYQRKMVPKTLMVTTTPMPPPSRRHTTISPIHELAHQITDAKEYERYYAKWPHLAQVQSQLHDEELREQLELQNLQQQQLGNYQDYEYDEDYFEALQQPDRNEENIPPYIRKYNRRNKQLLDLLEGTLPPPTRPPQRLRWSGSKLQPGPRESSAGSVSVRIDDDYLKEKRRRYHQRQNQIHDLFEQQRSSSTTSTTTAPSSTTKPPSPYSYGIGSSKSADHTPVGNHLPDEDLSISQESLEIDSTEPQQWQRGKAKSLASAAASSTSLASKDLKHTALGATPKPAMFKLPNYPSIAGSFIQRPRSRSAQFAPSSGSEYRRVTPFQYASPASGNSFINAGGFAAYNGALVRKNTQQHSSNGKSMSSRFAVGGDQNEKGGLTPKAEETNTSSNNSSQQRVSNSSSAPPSPGKAALSALPGSAGNSFVYHRVVDASPRLVGAGLTGRKQRLPFVAITDRRLETSKKSLADHQKDFEQNHYPMP